MSETYYLPSDEEEWGRLDRQHIAVLVGLGSLYPVPDTVRAILTPQDGVDKRVLDLGCGTGVWYSASLSCPSICLTVIQDN